MALPVKAAADLAHDMAKKGISGHIAMKLPSHNDDESYEDSPDDKSEDMLHEIAGDAYDALQSGSKEDFCKYLVEFMERACAGKHDGGDDEEEGEQPSMPMMPDME